MDDAIAPKICSINTLCCGCGACLASCPKGAIIMESDQWGFRYPKVNPDLCIACKLCERVCPAIVVREKNGCEAVIWARARDEELLKRSSSGGIFGLLAHACIARGGLVVGAAWDDDCRRVVHVIVEESSKLDIIMRSKYVQSTIDAHVYCSIRAALIENRPVLFSGTPCQVLAVNNYLGPLQKKGPFLAVDIICHGVPAPNLWIEWVDFIERRKGGHVAAVNMRSKSTGWLTFSEDYEVVSSSDGSRTIVSERFDRDWYMRAFLANASLRPSCFSCPAKCSSGSDITLGDYWGVESRQAEAYDNRGVSAVIVNSKRGLLAFQEIQPMLHSGKSSLDRVISGNSAFVKSVDPYSKYEKFMADVASDTSISELVGTWTFEPSIIRKIGRRFKSAVRWAIKRE